MTLIALLLGCGLLGTPSQNSNPSVMPATWREVKAPHAGLRCWHTYAVASGAVVCEANPTATHGAVMTIHEEE